MEAEGFLDRFAAQIILKKEYTEPRASAVAKLISLSRQGHLCATFDELGEAIASFTSPSIMRDQNRFYLQKNWVYETLILKHIQRLRNLAPPSFFDRSLFKEKLELLCEKKLLAQQGLAIGSALNSCLTLICGGPGTGKTYTASQLVSLLLASVNKEKKKHFRVCLSAPTGKAAAHLRSALSLEESSFVETSTLHRLLKLQPQENRLFLHRIIDADLVIVDEASMIDVPLLAHLLDAISDRTLLVLMGDPDQLPPVEAASLFSEMASSFGMFLQKSLRTEEAHLQKLSAAIQQGDESEMVHILSSTHSSLVHLSWDFDYTLAQKLYDQIEPLLSWEKPDPQKSIEKYQHCRILNALRQGPFGVDHLNERMFQLLQQKKQKGQWWAVPILVTVNDPRSGLYNGTSGVLIGQQMKDAIAYFPDESKEGIRSFPMPPSYELAFCLSIHKSQGSEFEEVIALFPEGSENFGREALYTAVTRSKKVLQIAGRYEILQKMIKNHCRKRSGFLERQALSQI